MATDLGMATMEGELKQGGAGPGNDPEVGVCKQRVERVRALEDSLTKIRKEGGGKGASAGSSGRRRLCGTAVERAGNEGEPPRSTFQMPMHYPRYRKADYEAMPEWRLDRLLQEYGLPVDVASTLSEKREYAMGVFLWSHQRES